MKGEGKSDKYISIDPLLSFEKIVINLATDRPLSFVKMVINLAIDTSLS